MSIRFLSVSTAVALTTAALGQAPSPSTEPEVKPMTIGDPARPIDIQHWIKGEKVGEFKPGNVYVLEFWATWCGPCRDGMPHLAELQTKYEDYKVTIVGISDEKLETVENFLTQNNKKLNKPWNEVIQYTLTTDPDKSVKTDYFVAAGQRGIPSAFIIGKDQRIEWIGNPHPMSGDGFDKALDKIVKDEWNRAEYKAMWEKKRAVEIENAKLQRDLTLAARAKEWDKAIQVLEQMIETNPEGAEQLRITKFQILLAELNHPDAYGLGEQIAKDNWDSAPILNQIAWFVVDHPTLENRNLDFALKLAGRANELTNDKDAAILDTFARVYYEKGDLKNALRLEKKAVENAEAGEMAEELRKTLKKYEDEYAAKKSG